MRTHSAVETETPVADAEPSNRERRIQAGYRRLLRAIFDGRSEVRSPKSKVQSPRSKGRSLKSTRRTAEEYLGQFLCWGIALVLAATGCVGPRPLKGGQAVLTRSPNGSVQQTLTQSENPAQSTKQDQETIKVRTYSVPAGSCVESRTGVSPAPDSRPAQAGRSHPSTLNSPASTCVTLSAPMPVVEREETHTRTELGAAQKDTARELGAKLSSLKGLVWVGVGLFVFGLASLVYPPLKGLIGSVTTSAAMMLGGVTLVVLPTLLVSHELLILGAVGLSVGGWFLAHRHGQLRGEVSSLKSKV